MTKAAGTPTLDKRASPRLYTARASLGRQGVGEAGSTEEAESCPLGCGAFARRTTFKDCSNMKNLGVARVLRIAPQSRPRLASSKLEPT